MKKRIVSIILLLLLLSCTTVFADISYKDVNENDYFYVSVLFASEKGIIHGDGNGQFNPEKMLTVAEAVKIAACINASFYGKDIKPYENQVHWADCYYDYALENGIISESDFAKADFDTEVTRDVLFRIFAHSLPESEYVAINSKEDLLMADIADYTEKLLLAGIITAKEIEPDKNILRSDSVILISRMMAYSRRQIVNE